MNKCILTAMLLILLTLTGCTSNPYIYDDTSTLVNTQIEYNINEPKRYDYLPEAETEDYSQSYTKPQNAVAISANSLHALAVLEDGSLWVWGTAGRVGNGVKEDVIYPVKIMDNVVYAVAALDSSFAITSDRELWAWGFNSRGQLGDGTTEYRLSPVFIMDDVVHVVPVPEYMHSHANAGGRTYAITADNTLWGWGGSLDIFGFIGDGSDTSDHYQPSPVMIMENVMQVSPTLSGGFAITTDGVLWGWCAGRPFRRYNEYEQAYVWIRTEPQPYPIRITEDIAYIGVNFAITNDGALWFLEDTPVWIMDDVVHFSGASRSFFVIDSAETLWAWGENRLPGAWADRPLLGDGTTHDRDMSVVIMENMRYVVTKGNATFAIDTNDTLWAWGNNGGLFGAGILGDGTIFDADSVEDYMWVWVSDDYNDGPVWLLDDDGGTGLRLSPVRILDNVASIDFGFSIDHGVVGSFNSFALTKCGSVWAWGDNYFWGLALLGDGTHERRLSPVQIIEGR